MISVTYVEDLCAYEIQQDKYAKFLFSEGYLPRLFSELRREETREGSFYQTYYVTIGKKFRILSVSRGNDISFLLSLTKDEVEEFINQF